MPKKPSTEIAKLRLRVWIEKKNQIYIGIGSTRLLQHIEQLGSLRKAAEALGMSYRRAWGKLKRTEERVGYPLVEKVKGQGQRFTLTPEGAHYMTLFLQFYRDVELYAQTKASEILGIKVTSSHSVGGDDRE